MDKAPLIVYHADCADGFTAAWVAHRHFQALGIEPELRRGIYGQGAVCEADVAGRDVYLLDFSYRRAHIEALAAAARSLTLLDHHESAWKEWGEIAPEGSGHEGLLVERGNMHVYFRRDQSGAMMAWMHFNPNYQVPAASAQDRAFIRHALGMDHGRLDMEAVELVRYVEDRDLWRFALPQSREVNAWIFSHPYDLAEWDELAYVLNRDELKSFAIREGRAIERKHFKDIKEFAALAVTDMLIGGRLVAAVNCPYHWGADMGHHLLAEYPAIPFAATWYERSDGRRVFGLRSRKGSDVNVAEIAKAYGGGGHPNAAGFDMPSGWAGDRP